MSEEIGELPSIRSHVLRHHLVSAWCNCDFLAWHHSILFALTFQTTSYAEPLPLPYIFNTVFSLEFIVSLLYCLNYQYACIQWRF